MMSAATFFLDDESGAISVDYVVLAAAAVAMAIAATDVIRGGLGDLSSNLEAQLRTQQISDAFVVFTSNHFDELYDLGILDEEQAEVLFDAANEKTNGELLNELGEYLAKMVDGTITETEAAEAYALASVAHQRNIISDDDISNYFADAGATFTDTSS